MSDKDLQDAAEMAIRELAGEENNEQLKAQAEQLHRELGKAVEYIYDASRCLPHAQEFINLNPYLAEGLEHVRADLTRTRLMIQGLAYPLLDSLRK